MTGVQPVRYWKPHFTKLIIYILVLQKTIEMLKLIFSNLPEMSKTKMHKSNKLIIELEQVRKKHGFRYLLNVIHIDTKSPVKLNM